MTERYLTAADAAAYAGASRQDIDAACVSGALFAVDIKPQSSRRSWRIHPRDVDDWHHRGRPLRLAASPPAA